MKLTSLQMATFVAKGYLRFDGVVPEDLNQRLLERFSAIDPSQSRQLGDYYGKAMAERVLPVCDSGVPLAGLFSIRRTFRRYWISLLFQVRFRACWVRDRYLIITSCTSRFLQANDVAWVCQIRRNTIIRTRPSILRWHSISSCFTSRRR